MAQVELLSGLCFARCHSGPPLLLSKVGICYIFLWVDDLLIFRDKKLLKPLVDRILVTFDGRGMKELHHVLGVEMKRDWLALSFHYKK